MSTNPPHYKRYDATKDTEELKTLDNEVWSHFLSDRTPATIAACKLPRQSPLETVDEFISDMIRWGIIPDVGPSVTEAIGRCIIREFYKTWRGRTQVL